MDTTLSWMIYGSLVILAIGLLTSTSLLALSHILIAFPALYFLNKTDYKKLPVSAWALLALVIILLLSILLNQDIAVKGYAPVSKLKYFLLAFLAVGPLTWFFRNHSTDKKISWLLVLFCIATTFATVAGLIGLATGKNPVLMKAAHPDRNSGLFGMLMNYAHNLSFFLIILTGLVIYRDEAKKWINVNFLIIVYIINLVGLYYTYTRGAWLGLLIGVPFFFYKKHKKFFIGIFIGLIILGVTGYFVAGKKVIRPQSETERISQWEASVKAFQERPLLGYGYLNFESHSGEIKKRYDLGSVNFVSHAHSNLFEMLGSAGILGFVAFIVWLGSWARETYQGEDLVSKIGLPFLITFFVCGLTQSTITLGINLFFIMAGWSLCATRRSLS